MDLQEITLPQLLKNSTVLLDTNFFIDSFPSQNREGYGKFVGKLKEMGVAFVAPNLVRYEFIRSKTIDVVREKEAYFQQIVDTILPYDPTVDKLVIPTIEEYKQYMERLPLTDLILAAYLKRYKGLFLLTRDHSDFPTSVFTREYIFNVESFREKIYAIYSYKPKVSTLKEAISDIPF